MSTVITLYLRRVRVDDAHVLNAVRSLQQHLLHVAPQRGHHRLVGQRRVDQTQKLRHVPHELLADALARAVDAQLQAGGREEHGRSEHRDADGLAEPVLINFKLLKKICVKYS